MRGGFKARNVKDDLGRPTGGVVVGTGFTIAWQDGPLGHGDGRKDPNGAFVEDVIDACIQRLRFFQASEFRCEENETAIRCLEAANAALDRRTTAREIRGVEGTHVP